MAPRARSAAVLPEEFIVWEILLRLPAKDVIRCRAVCRAWRERTSAPDFLLAHHRHQPSLLLVSVDIGVSIGAAFDALNLRQRPAERQPVLRIGDYRHCDLMRKMIQFRYRHSYKLHASRDGLILLSLPRDHISNFYICNPATRQWISLPRLRYADVVGMYSHSPSGEYRILCWERATIYYVHTVGSSASAEEPRCIGQPIASPSVQVLVEQGLIPRSEFEGQPVLLHGCLFWIREEKGIVVFDTVTESFWLMHLPTRARQLAEKPAFWHLIEMNGTLGVSWGSEDETMLKLWVLQDYETEDWSLRYQLDFSLVKKGYVSPGRFLGMFVSDDGDVLIYSSGSYRVFHINRKGKLLQVLKRDLLNLWLTGVQFRESLFRHAFFEEPREGVSSEEPQFFVGL